MARKNAEEFAKARAKRVGQSAVQRPAGREKAAYGSWAAVGVDTSMTACSAVGVGYDSLTVKYLDPVYAEIRWMPEDDYFKRLGEAAKGHELLLDILKELWVIEIDRVLIAIEEPFYFGATKKGASAWLKQQAEVAGAFKGSLVRYGFQNIYEINNSQWHATLRKAGAEFQKVPRDSLNIEKVRIKLANKFVVKTWAIESFGLPNLPDLVKSKSGAKIPRPASGFGAKARPEQPNDVYDAAACCAWMMAEVLEGRTNLDIV